MSECFVYVTLPGQEAAVTAGRFALDAGRDGVPVGRFVYGRRYLERDDAVELDPVEHALLAGDRHWQLALAYDLTPNPQVSIERRALAMRRRWSKRCVRWCRHNGSPPCVPPGSVRPIATGSPGHSCTRVSSKKQRAHDMQPLIVAEQVRQGVADFLAATIRESDYMLLVPGQLL